MSFYVGSMVIGEDLAELKTSKPFQTFLSSSKFKAFPHCLHQTESKPLALFSGKSPKHTWRQNLQEQFKEYLDCYLTDPNAVSNIFGEDAQVPLEIPFFFKVSKVRGNQS